MNKEIDLYLETVSADQLAMDILASVTEDKPYKDQNVFTRFLLDNRVS